METNRGNLFIGFLIGVVLIVLYVYIPYEIQERREIQHRKEVVDSLKKSFYHPPKNKIALSKDS